MTLTAKTASTVRNVYAQVNRGTGSQSAAFQSGGPQTKQVYVAVWDNSVEVLPAAGILGLGTVIPVGFVVTNVHFDVEVVPVGPTNMSISLVNDADLSASAAIAGAPWSSTGIKSGANVNAGAVEVAKTVQGPLVITAAKEILLTGTGAVSTAGRVVIYVEGFMRPSALTQGADLA